MPHSYATVPAAWSEGSVPKDVQDLAARVYQRGDGKDAIDELERVARELRSAEQKRSAAKVKVRFTGPPPADAPDAAE